MGVRTISEFFDEDIAETIIKEEGIDAFLAANVMCHIPEIESVVKGISKLLKPTGVVMFEDPYLGDVVSKTSYDQIYDEHVFLFSALSVQFLFGLHGMELIDVLPQKTHGGSMRYVLAHQGTAIDPLLKTSSQRKWSKDYIWMYLENTNKVKIEDDCWTSGKSENQGWDLQDMA